MFLDPFSGCPQVSPHVICWFPHMLSDTFPYLGFVLGWELVLTGPVYKVVWFATGDLCPGVLVTNEVLLLGSLKLPLS